MNNIILDELPLDLKNPFNFNKLYTRESCNVSVIWIVYDKNKKIILSKGVSRPCGFNHGKTSIHAEQQAINYCRRNNNKTKYVIYIWRYGKTGNVKPMYCCTQCTKMAKKYNYTNKIFTFNQDNICPAVIDDPPLSLAYKTYLNKI